MGTRLAALELPGTNRIAARFAFVSRIAAKIARELVVFKLRRDGGSVVGCIFAGFLGAPSVDRVKVGVAHVVLEVILNESRKMEFWSNHRFEIFTVALGANKASLDQRVETQDSWRVGCCTARRGQVAVRPCRSLGRFQFVARAQFCRR